MSTIAFRPPAAALPNGVVPRLGHPGLAPLVAAAALLSHADGEVAPAERSRLVDMLTAEPALAGVPRTAIVDAFAEHEANYRLDPEVAIEIAYEKLDAIRGQPPLCSTVVSVCRALIAADGIVHPSERRMLADIRARLGVTGRPVRLGELGATRDPAPQVMARPS